MAETRTIRTILELNAQRFQSGAAAAARSAKNVHSELARLSDSTGEFRADFDRAGTTLLGLGGAAVTGLGLATKAAMDWESAWAGVRKTVDGTDAELSALEEGLRGLARELPASHQEIAAVAEAAGQLGVAREDVVDFTRTMINLGETTNLTADEAATSIAQFTNVMGTSSDEVDNLGAALVALGNDGASTEAEIMSMAQRLSGAGALIGASEEEVLGLSSALASVGISAEAGGGSLSRVLQKMNTEVLAGSGKLEIFAETAGVSAEEFAAAWRDSPTAALDMFLQGLNGVTESGGNAVSVLGELGIKSTEETRALLSLAGAGDLLSSSIETSNQAWAEQTALVEEAAKRYETTEARVQLARNALVDAGIDLGASVLPILAEAAEGAATLAGAFSQLPAPVQSAVTGFGALAGGSALLAGGLMKVVPAAGETLASFRRLREESPRTARALGRVATGVGILGAAFTAATTISAYGDSLTDFTLGANEAADAAMKLARGGDVTNVFAGLGDDAKLAATSTEQLASELDILANGHWYAGISDMSANLQNAFGANLSTIEDYRERLDQIGQSLAALYEADAPQAREAFANLWAEFGSTDEAGVDLLKTMPALRDELIGVANAAGLATDDQTLLKIASGEIIPVVDEATGEVTGYTEGLEDVADASDEAASKTAELLEQIDSLADGFLDARAAARDYEDALSDAQEVLDENGKAWENGTEQARENAEAIDDVARSVLDNAESMRRNGEDVGGYLESQRKVLWDLARDLGATEDEATAYVDALGLTPESISTVVELEKEQAEADLQALWAELGTHPPQVPVSADTTPAEGDVQEFSGAVMDGDPASVPVTADTDAAVQEVYGFQEVVESGSTKTYVEADLYTAEEQIRAFQRMVNEQGGTIEINGETYNAEEALDYLVEEVNNGEGTVTINGTPVNAESVLVQLVDMIDEETGTVTIDADPSAAESKANRAARDRDSTIDVDADTGAANFAIDLAARTRTAYINVIARNVGSTIGTALSGRAGGGWLTPGLAAGGWVPGSYPGPGVDNVLWPLASGGRVLSQPLAGTEFVVNGRSARQWGPALEAINAGVSRRELAALVGSQAGGGVSIAQQISGLNAYEVARESRAQMQHVLRDNAITL